MSDQKRAEDDRTDSVLGDDYIDEENGREFTEEELELLFQAAEEEEESEPPIWQSPRFRTILVGIMVFALCAQGLALLPRIYSFAAIEFLATSASLSQMESIQQYKESIVVIRTNEAKGTGFIISEEGLVVTNRHVIDDASRPTVHLSNGESYRATIVAIAEDVDLALIDIEAKGIPALTLARHYDGEAGKPVYVIGNPLFFTNVANEGETLGLIPDGQVSWMVLDAPIYRGNSGSPVLTHDGEVIGIIFATSTMQQDDQNRKVGLAVPVDWVWKLTQEVAG